MGKETEKAGNGRVDMRGKMKIFIVMATTGEYSDRDEWLVCAYQDKAKAEDHIVRAGKEAANIYQKGSEEDYFLPTGDYSIWLKEVREKLKNKYDAEYAGNLLEVYCMREVSYYLEETNLIGGCDDGLYSIASAVDSAGISLAASRR